MKKSTIEKISEYLTDVKALEDSKNKLAIYQKMKSRCMTTKKQTYDRPIRNMQQIVEDLQLIVNRDEANLSRMIHYEDDRFRVFYLHVVKKKSLTETAYITNYSRIGVCKIISNIKQKCILLNK